jgi:hypothetical protein
MSAAPHQAIGRHTRAAAKEKNRSNYPERLTRADATGPLVCLPGCPGRGNSSATTPRT